MRKKEAGWVLNNLNVSRTCWAYQVQHFAPEGISCDDVAPSITYISTIIFLRDIFAATLTIFGATCRTKWGYQGDSVTPKSKFHSEKYLEGFKVRLKFLKP